MLSFLQQTLNRHHYIYTRSGLCHKHLFIYSKCNQELYDLHVSQTNSNIVEGNKTNLYQIYSFSISRNSFTMPSSLNHLILPPTSYLPIQYVSTQPL